MYKNGDEVIWKGEVHRVIVCSHGSVLLSDWNDDWQVAEISEIVPIIGSNKQGKHLLEKLDD